MFHSISEAWRSASETNMADVKELIPEFFYLAEFFTNSNHFDLGECRRGRGRGGEGRARGGGEREGMEGRIVACSCAGIKQNAERLDDVVLPPWAKGDTHEFIRLHREVSYSEVVMVRVMVMMVRVMVKVIVMVRVVVMDSY